MGVLGKIATGAGVFLGGKTKLGSLTGGGDDSYSIDKTKTENMVSDQVNDFNNSISEQANDQLESAKEKATEAQHEADATDDDLTKK